MVSGWRAVFLDLRLPFSVSLCFSLIEVARQTRPAMGRAAAEANDACFIVPDANGQAPAYFYFEPGRPRACWPRTRRGARRQHRFVRDANGQALGHSYFEDEPGRGFRL